MKILCFVQYDDKVNGVSKEAVSLSQEVAEKTDGSVDIVTFNKDASEKLKVFDSNKLIFVNNPSLDEYNPLYYTACIEKLFNDGDYDTFIIGHTYETRDWVPRLSARCDTPFISDCIDYSLEGDSIEWIRSLYRAKINSKIKSTYKRTIISVQSGCFKAENIKPGNSAVDKIDIDLSGIEKTIVPGEKFKESGNQVDLTSSDVIVSIGRGISKEENIPMAEELAKNMGGLLSSSRPVVDSGWLDHSLQIGSSGQVVSPKLYLALGISGAIQHTVGMKGSKSIISINKDKNAPIFELSDYGVIGDILEILPKLNQALKEI
ncbi:MAG: electron transfer flavoprotein subunit alpha [Candidatus Marinimicrobia bacterium]|nr:electron transfer flavoprotein subunit alpha [Candidatus Neomarinimicrobiota bacterium]|tara:strand:+ start:7516 stop:8472 length:957 start_codon:yes stop_codon:yes gene_type:complete